MELLVISGNLRNFKAPVLNLDFNGWMMVPVEIRAYFFNFSSCYSVKLVREKTLVTRFLMKRTWKPLLWLVFIKVGFFCQDGSLTLSLLSHFLRPSGLTTGCKEGLHRTPPKTHVFNETTTALKLSLQKTTENTISRPSFTKTLKKGVFPLKPQKSRSDHESDTTKRRIRSDCVLFSVLYPTYSWRDNTKVWIKTCRFII